MICLASLLVGHQRGGELRQIACRIFSFSANLILESIGKEKDANYSQGGDWWSPHSAGLWRFPVVRINVLEEKRGGVSW